MTHPQTILGPILNPRADGKVDFMRDGAIHCDALGRIDFIGREKDLPPSLAGSSRRSQGLVLPPLLDAHIHIPQHPIRGHFMDGVGENPPEGRLLAGLNRNVFPAEAKCADSSIAEAVVAEFARDTLAKGVVGGAAYVTIHPDATGIALSHLGEFWSAGLVLMENNCPEYLRVDPTRVIEQMGMLADRFGKRYIVTDRFAVAVGSPLRQAAARFATDRGLRMQTHLNEQVSEKRFVEQTLYPHHASYTHVYHNDGLLDRSPIMAHCIQMSDAEFALLAQTQSVVAHCPTSNTLLCSGVMPLDRLLDHGIDYAICTDVGASPTTSMLAEMAQFLKVHAGRSARATPAKALYRSTLAPARILGLEERIGSFEVGKPMSFIEVEADLSGITSADDAILTALLGLHQADLDRFSRPGPMHDAREQLAATKLDVGPAFDLLDRDVRDTAKRLENKVLAVTLAGEEVWRRPVSLSPANFTTPGRPSPV